MFDLSVVDKYVSYDKKHFYKAAGLQQGPARRASEEPTFLPGLSLRSDEKSISDSPEMLDLRELIVFPSEGRYIVVCGNLRYVPVRIWAIKNFPARCCQTIHP